MRLEKVGSKALMQKDLCCEHASEGDNLHYDQAQVMDLLSGYFDAKDRKAWCREEFAFFQKNSKDKKFLEHLTDAKTNVNSTFPFDRGLLMIKPHTKKGVAPDIGHRIVVPSGYEPHSLSC